MIGYQEQQHTRACERLKAKLSQRRPPVERSPAWKCGREAAPCLLSMAGADGTSHLDTVRATQKVADPCLLSVAGADGTSHLDTVRAMQKVAFSTLTGGACHAQSLARHGALPVGQRHDKVTRFTACVSSGHGTAKCWGEGRSDEHAEPHRHVDVIGPRTARPYWCASCTGCGSHIDGTE